MARSIYSIRRMYQKPTGGGGASEKASDTQGYPCLSEKDGTGTMSSVDF